MITTYHYSLSNSPYLLGKYKHIRYRRISQDIKLIDPQLNPQISSNIVQFIKSFNPRQRRVLNALLYWSSTTGKIYLRQDTLAKHAGYCRQTVNEFIGKLIEWGFIVSNYRHNTSCEYKVSSFFNDVQIRSQLKPYLSALAFFPICLVSQWIEKNPTQYNSINLLIHKQTTNNTKDLDSACARERELFVEKGKVVEVKQEIAHYVEKITYPLFSHEQKVLLSGYSEKEVVYAIGCLNQKQGVNSPASFVLGICRNRAANTQNKYTKPQTQPKEKPHTPIDSRTESEKKVRDAAFWKKDDEKLAHWDTDQLAEQITAFLRSTSFGGKELLEMFTSKFKQAQESHDDKTCHICLEQGITFKTPAKFYTLPNKTTYKPVDNAPTLGYTMANSPQQGAQRSIRELIKEQLKID